MSLELRKLRRGGGGDWQLSIVVLQESSGERNAPYLRYLHPGIQRGLLRG